MDIVAVIAVVCAFIVKGMSGFANTLVFNSIMSYTTGNINITPIELLIGYPSNIIIAWKERRGISWKICLQLSVYVLIGIIPGMYFLLKGNAGSLKILFGFVIILLGIEMLLRDRQKKQKAGSPLAIMIIGILSGVLCGLFGVGAFLVAYISRTTDNQSQFKSNLCFVFFIENTFRIILYSAIGILKPDMIKTAVLLMPFMLLGLAAGMLISKKTNERLTKKIIIILLILSGISLIANNIRL